MNKTAIYGRNEYNYILKISSRRFNYTVCKIDSSGDVLTEESKLEVQIWYGGESIWRRKNQSWNLGIMR